MYTLVALNSSAYLIQQLWSTLSSAEENDFLKYLAGRKKNGFDIGLQLFKAVVRGSGKTRMGHLQIWGCKEKSGRQLEGLYGKADYKKDAFDEVYLIKQLLLIRKLIRYKTSKLPTPSLCKAQVNAGCAQLSSIYVEINRGELERFVELQQIDQIQMVNAHTIGLQQHVSSAGQRIAITRVKRAFKEAERLTNT